MKVKTKVLLATIAITSISLNANAQVQVQSFDAGNKDWQLIEPLTATTGLYKSEFGDGETQHSMISLEQTVNGKMSVYRSFTTPLSACPEKTDIADSTPITQYVNGRAVKMSYYYSDIGVLTSTATTKEGQLFMIDEFIYKNTVNWQGVVYSAKNFTKVALKVMENRESAL